MQTTEVIVTAGDPAGVGPEILVSVLGAADRPPPGITLVCDGDLLAATAQRLASLSPEFEETVRRFRNRLNGEIEVLEPTAKAAPFNPGVWAPDNVPFIRESLAEGLAIARQRGAALVTGPSDKRFFVAEGLAHSGHTEYLAQLAGEQAPVMLFDGGSHRTAVLTRHIPLRQVASRVTPDRLRRGAQLAAQYVRAVEGDHPRPVAIAGLDPHCGEWGASSGTDLEVAGWVRTLTDEGVPIEGPFPADTLFVAGRWERYGVVLCWYHDQGMIPVKLNSFSQAVNVTLGLPVARCAPAHGVAYDIAGTGRADTGSFRRAIHLAGSPGITNLTTSTNPLPA